MASKYTNRLLKDVFGTFKSSPGRLTTVSLFALLSPAANLLAPYSLVKSIDILDDSSEKNDTKVYLYMMGFVALWTASRIMQQLRIMLLSKPSASMSHRLTREVVEKFYHKPMQYRVIESSAQEIQLFSSNYEHVSKNILVGVFGRIIPSMLEVVATILITIFIDRYASIVVAATTFFYFLSIYFGSKKIGKAQTLWNTAAFEALKGVTSALEQYENSHYNQNVEFELNLLSASLSQFDKAHVKAERKREVVNIVQLGIICAGFAVALAVIIYEYLHKQSDKTTLFWLVLYLGQYAAALSELAKALSDINHSIASYNDYIDYVDEEHVLSQDSQKEGLPAAGSDGMKVEFKGVTLRYPGEDNDTIRDVTFTVSPGQRIVLVGESGSGKSSIQNLLCKFYQPTDGYIYLNDIDSARVNSESIRSQMAVIPQSGHFTNDTIFANVKYAYNSATDAEVHRAIKAAKLDNLLRRVGNEFKIGEGGRKLSGGQKQRLSIARAILRAYHGAKLLLVDEPTSALDEKTAKGIIRLIDKTTRDMNMTLVMITHNLRHVNSHLFDKVIILNDGEIAEQGEIGGLVLTGNGIFKELLRKNGINSEDATDFPCWLSEQDDFDDEVVSTADDLSPTVAAAASLARSGSPVHHGHSLQVGDDESLPLLQQQLLKK